jgi:hypothetical protein
MAIEGPSVDFVESIRIPLQEFIQKALANFIDSDGGLGQVGGAVLRVDASVLQSEGSGSHAIDRAVLVFSLSRQFPSSN